MKTLFVGQNSIHLGTVDSTNSYASELLRQNSVIDGTIVVSYQQQNGRGQRGNKWLSEPDKNVAMSVILHPTFLPASQQFLLTKAVSLAVADLMAAMLPGEVHIKWPNDIYVNEKKIAGILIENTLRDGKIQHSVVGIGLNVNQEMFDLIGNATSMAIEAGNMFVLDDLVTDLCSLLEARYLQLRAEKKEALDEDYLSRLFRVDEWHSYESAAGRFKACIQGVSEEGKLKMLVFGGELKTFNLQEIRFVV